MLRYFLRSYSSRVVNEEATYLLQDDIAFAHQWLNKDGTARVSFKDFYDWYDNKVQTYPKI
jgi:hypothetical protein